MGTAACGGGVNGETPTSDYPNPMASMDSLLQDLRYAVRTLLKSPGFAAAAVLTLALGIGANSTIFAVVHAALLRPLPYPDPDRIVSISTLTVFGDTKLADEPSIARWADEARSFEVIAAYWSGEANLTGGAGPEHVRGASVTEGFFRVMGVTPALGRAFSEEELRYEGAPVVILGQGLWRRAFGGAADVIGRTVRLDGVDHTVIGVMPAGFAFPDSAEYWRPMRLQSTVADGSADFSYAIGRLRPGVPLEEARAELEAIRRRAEDLPERFRELGVAVVTLHERLHGDLRPGLLVLLGAVGCVLLIACANVANLLLARATTRRRELAVRSALGATRARLARQLLVECTLLALLGGAAGLLIPAWGLDVLERLAPAALARIPEIRLDAAVLGFTFVVSIATGLVFGLAPAFTASRTPVQYALKEATPTTAGWRGRSRQALVAAELALAVLLLLGAGLFLRSFHAFRAADPGFDPEGVVTARYWLPFASYPDESSQRAFRQAVLERLRAIPGVEAATITRAGPLGGFHATQQFIPPGGDPESAPTVAYVHVGTDYF
ncbi:MAG TPA: ABC transporter permease, partial [Nannocystis sp.]